MNDGYIQVPADDVGKKVDTAELTRPDGTLVERQRVSIGDDGDPRKKASVDYEGNVSVSDEKNTLLLHQILSVLEEIRDVLWSSSH
jgi:hypothetical protein